MTVMWQTRSYGPVVFSIEVVFAPSVACQTGSVQAPRSLTAK